MAATREQKAKLLEKLTREDNWHFLPRELFGEPLFLYDLEPKHYNYFLDNVETIYKLREGLHLLSPLADDALAIAEKMSGEDFSVFKLALAYERKREDSRMPREYLSLLAPPTFIPAILAADKFQVSLGTSLIQLMMLEDN